MTSVAARNEGIDMTTLVYDPYDYDIDANPHPVWKRLRDEAPVYYNDEHDFYALSRFDDVLRRAPRSGDVQLRAHDRARDDGAGAGRVHDAMMIFMDPPRAHALPQAREPRVHAAAHGRARARVRRSPARFLDEFVGAGALRLRRRLRRAPARDGHLRAARRARGGRSAAPRMVRRHAAHRSGRDDGLRSDGHSAARFTTTGRRIIDDRRRTPRDDIMSELMAAELDEGDGSARHLTDDEIHAFMGLLSGAGNETVARFLGHRHTSLAVRERLAFTPEQTRDALAAWRVTHPDHEAVLLSTCHRVELYAARSQIPKRISIRRRSPITWPIFTTCRSKKSAAS